MLNEIIDIINSLLGKCEGINNIEVEYDSLVSGIVSFANKVVTHNSV